MKGFFVVANFNDCDQNWLIVKISSFKVQYPMCKIMSIRNEKYFCMVQ